MPADNKTTACTFSQESKQAPNQTTPHNNMSIVSTKRTARDALDRTIKMQAIAEETIDEHRLRMKTFLESMPLKFIVDQLSPVVLQGNRANPKIRFQCIDEELLRAQRAERISMGESLATPEKLSYKRKQEEEEVGEVEMVKCGGKGQLMRVVHPPSKRKCSEDEE